MILMTFLKDFSEIFGGSFLFFIFTSQKISKNLTDLKSAGRKPGLPEPVIFYSSGSGQILTALDPS